MSQSASSTHNSTPLPHDTLDNQQPQVKFETLPLTREQSSRHQRNSSRESFSSSSKVGRFSIEKEDAPPLPFEETLHPFETPSIVPGSPEYRKKGRFELTGAMTPAERLESPHTTLNGNSSQASVAAGLAALMQSDERRNHNTKSPSLMTMDPQQQQLVYALLKQTEIQKAMLQDLLFGLSHGGGVSSRARSSSATTAADVRKFSTSSSSIDSHPSFSVDSPRK
jgi:hypothetical protein